MRKTLYAATSLAVIAALATAGCASRGYVDDEVRTVHTRIDSLEGVVEDAQERLDSHEAEIQSLSRTAQEALDRAQEAGKLAEGKFLYETVLTDNEVRFGFDRYNLTDSARAALDAFAARLKEQDRNVYIEIQGHTDSVGHPDYNMRLGERRANAVRDYLGRQHGVALHRMSVLSYGETAPIASNDTREGRSQNRRVTLVVLQ